MNLTINYVGNFLAVPHHFLPNPTYPTSRSYEIVPLLPDGLQFDQVSGVISGTPHSPLPTSVFNITQLTSLAGSAPCVNLVSSVVLSIVTCDQRTCRGGTCMFGAGNSPFAGNFSCVCPAGKIGSRCEFNNPFHTSTPKYQEALSVAVLVVLMVIAAVASFMHRRLTGGYASLHRRLLDAEKEVHMMKRTFLIGPTELRIKKEIARGSSGVVFKATWNELPVAVKKLRGDIESMDEITWKEFETEVNFMRSIRHPHIVLFHGAGLFEDGMPFLVTEFVARGSLDRVLANSAEIAWNRKVQFAHETALGDSVQYSGVNVLGLVV